jgi:hypothetical protein
MVDTIEAKGVTGRVTFDGQYVTIVRTGALGRPAAGVAQTRLHIAEITGIGWRPAGLTRGTIRFEMADAPGRHGPGGDGRTAGAGERNTVAFRGRQQPEFAELKVAVERAMAVQRGTPIRGVEAPSTAGEIARLSHLVQSGAITQEEFRQAKARLLGDR